jgi:serine/threonine-protein kinase
MKFLEGQSLDQLLAEKGKMSLEETIDTLMPVADALDYGHLHSVIHRDIKPANIMVDPQGRVIVTDFGIAKALTESKLTASGSVIGTPFYMSPEQGMGKPVTGASDQYSVAVMTFRMLSGQIPFEGDSAIEILHKHCSSPPPPLQDLRPGLPDYVYKAIDKGLSKKPGQRFSTVKAYVKALKEPSSEITVSDEATVLVHSDPSIEDRISTEVIDRVEQPTPPPAQPRTVTKTIEKKSNVWKLLVPILALAAVGLGGGWWWTNRQPTGGAPEPTPQASAEQPGSAPPEQQAQEVATTVQTGTQTAEVEQSATTNPQADAPAPPAQTTGTVSVTNMMPSGLVLVDGVVQSGQIFELRPGQHRIEMRQPGYDTQSETLTIQAGQTIQLQFTARPIQTQQAAPKPIEPRPAAPQYGILSILLRPSPGGDVFIDGGLAASQTTKVEDRLETGRHRVRIERDGYATVDTIIVVSANDTTQLRLRLRKTRG